MNVYLISESNFKTAEFQCAWFSWFYDALLVSRFVFCANTVAHLCLQCASSRASSSTGSSGRLIIMAHKNHYLFFLLSNCTYNSNNKEWKFSCVLYGHIQFLCNLKVSNCQPWLSVIPAACLLIDCYATRHSRNLVFLQLWTALTQHWVCSTPLFYRFAGYFCSCERLYLRIPLMFITVTNCSLQQRVNRVRVD